MPQGDPLSYIQNAAEQVFRGIASTPDPQITSQLAKVLNDLTSIQEKVMATSGGAGTARGRGRRGRNRRPPTTRGTRTGSVCADGPDDAAVTGGLVAAPGPGSETDD
jgi:hypothetical protein